MISDARRPTSSFDRRAVGAGAGGDRYGGCCSGGEEGEVMHVSTTSPSPSSSLSGLRVPCAYEPASSGRTL